MAAYKEVPQKRTVSLTHIIKWSMHCTVDAWRSDLYLVVLYSFWISLKELENFKDKSIA
jgi:hypothetical protein